MSTKAFSNRVLVHAEKKKKEDGGLVVPKGTPSSEKYLKGKVASVGDRVGRDGSVGKMPLNEGDTVYYSAFGFSELTTDDGDFIVLQEEDILAVEV